MAIRYAVQSGDWSDPNTWDGGTLPGINDDVYSNTFQVDIDVDITVLSISNRSASGVSAGGGFLTIGDRTLNCDVYGPELSTANNNITLSTIQDDDDDNEETDIIIINGNIFGSIVSSTSTFALRIGRNDDVTINGDVDNNHNVSNQAVRCVNVFSGTNGLITKLTVNGDVYNRSPSASNKSAIVASSNTLITINGDIQQFIGGSNAFPIDTNGDVIATGDLLKTSNSAAVFGRLSSGNKQTIILNYNTIEANTTNSLPVAFNSEISEAYITGQFVSTGAGTNNRIRFALNGKYFYTGDITGYSLSTLDAPVDLFNNVEFYVYGNVRGGAVSTQRGINFISVNNIKLFVYGNVFNGTHSPGFSSFQQAAYGIINDTGNGEIDGNIVAICDGDSRSPAIASRGEKTIIEEIIVSDLGLFPVVGSFQVRNGVSVLKLRNENFEEVSYTDQSVNDYPIESDVRDGVEYGFNLEGNCKVPDPVDVRRNTPVDNTIGTAVLDADDFFDIIKTSSDPVAERLRRVATIENVGDQFNSFGKQL